MIRFWRWLGRWLDRLCQFDDPEDAAGTAITSRKDPRR